VSFVSDVPVPFNPGPITPSAVSSNGPKMDAETIENILSQIENNVYLNGDIAPNLKSKFSVKGSKGFKLNQENLKKLIDEFRRDPADVKFDGIGNFTNMLKTHKDWGPGGEINYREIAREYLRSLNR
jgi:hypothetical protein